MLVSLSMYDVPEARHLTDAWWQGLAGHLAELGFEGLPLHLNRTLTEEQVWTSPELLLSQTCGYPLALSGYRTLQPVLTLAYTAPGCEGSDYLSHIVVSEDSAFGCLEDLRATRLAYNSEQSNSGWRALRLLLEPVPGNDEFFQHRSVSGSHRQSLKQVQEGQADYCAVDNVTYALLARHAPLAVAGTRVLCHTPRSPGLPYVTSRQLSQPRLQRLRQGIFNALNDPGLATVHEGLLIGGGEVVELDIYMQMAS